MHFIKTLLITFISIKISYALMCSRYPSHTTVSKSPVDENFVILINGNPQTYILGAEYRITLAAFNGARFISFMLVLETDSGDMVYNDDLGHFEVLDDVETRYSINCFNMIENTNTNPKTHIEVKWVAPSEPGKGCILIRATVLESRDVWYMDDGGLSRRICEEIVDDVESNSLSADLNTCCACDEASYDIYFEGLWSRNLHPKDFPAQGFMTRFSDIVGASHTNDYRFWEYGQLAQEGMQEFAEHGALRLLQMEFNHAQKQGQIRTIVRARGPAFPNLNSHTISSVRVDPNHHLLSLASKIDPSPDWIVGVSGLELCLSNCTWLYEKTINLYPWDIGTDAGPSYLSPDQPQVPPDVIRRIRHDFPNDPRSPFFDENGEPMKPLAALTVRRKRIFEKICEDEDSNIEDLPRECATHPFTAWSVCSVKCGQGTQWRKRFYKQPEVAKIYNCDALTRNYFERTCYGNNCTHLSELNNEQTSLRENDCKLTRWSSWSSCSRTCGEGKMMRRRHFVNPENEEICQNRRFGKLIQYKKCVGRSCLGEINRAVDDNEKEENEDYENSNTNSHDRKPEPVEKEIEEIQNENQSRETWAVNDQAELALQIPEENEFDKQASERRLEDEEQTQRLNIPNKWRENNKQSDEEPEIHQPDSLRIFGNQNRKFEGKEEEYQPWQGSKNEINEENQDQKLFFNNKNRGAFTHKKHRWQQTESEEVEINGNKNYDWNVEEEKNIEDDQIESEEFPSKIKNRGKSASLGCCFQELEFFDCANSTVIANYWFYNFCADECQLYASDICDTNKNKFKSMEDCEANCRRADFRNILRKKQKECLRF